MRGTDNMDLLMAASSYFSQSFVVCRLNAPLPSQPCRSHWTLNPIDWISFENEKARQANCDAVCPDKTLRFMSTERLLILVNVVTSREQTERSAPGETATRRSRRAPRPELVILN